MSYVKSMLSHNFIEYASYVIKERAIPDVDDGLKPVQRRIFHSLKEMDDGKFNKVANIVGNTMKYHPHGDSSIYSALVNIANREYFIDRQGNFGNIFTGDEASAARYIECRLSPLAKDVLFNKALTTYSDSYDGRNKEPVLLPAKIPMLLLMGAEGIAVGMSTKIMPHNFRELLEAQIKILKKEDFTIYPDFIQGGIMDVSEYEKGNGKIKIRARIDVKDNKTLLIHEIPYGTTTESLIKSIESAAKKNKLKISSINDFTAENVEIEVKTSRGEDANDTIKALYAHTDCEVSISTNLIVIVDNKPKQMDVDEVLKRNTKKLVELLRLELQIEMENLEQKLHDLTLEQIFIENRIYKKIEELKTYSGIIKCVTTEMNKFKKLFIRDLVEEDIERLLQIKIKRISRYDIENHKNRMDDIVRALDLCKKRLKSVVKYAIEYIGEILDKYGNDIPRRTTIDNIETISVRDVAQPDVKIYWDRESGFFGTDVKGGHYFEGTAYDKFLAVSSDGTYKVVGVDKRAFIDTNVIYLDKYDENRVFCMIYTDIEKKQSYAKKFSVPKFITNKVYNLSPCEKKQVDFMEPGDDLLVTVRYKKKPRQKVNSEEYDFTALDKKGASARGNRVSNKEVVSIKKKKRK
jgi:topoisomerase-4 subunit A